MTEDHSRIGRIFSRVVVPRALDAVDPDSVIERVDVGHVVDRIDVDGVVARIDVEALLDRVDPNRLLDRVDADRLIRRVDLNDVLGRVDPGPVLARIDVAALVHRAGIDAIVAEATTGIVTRTIDLFRRQLVGIDVVVWEVVDRLLGRGRLRAPPKEVGYSGRPAGLVSRLVAFALDWLFVTASFTVIAYLGRALVQLLTGHVVRVTSGQGVWWAAAILGWWFAYLWLGYEIAGRTPGKDLVGLRVMALGGKPIRPWAAVRRIVLLPLVFVFGLGAVPAVLRHDRRALHDLGSGSCEVIDWGGRSARLPSALQDWLDRHRAGPTTPAPLVPSGAPGAEATPRAPPARPGGAPPP